MSWMYLSALLDHLPEGRGKAFAAFKQPSQTSPGPADDNSRAPPSDASWLTPVPFLFACNNTHILPSVYIPQSLLIACLYFDATLVTACLVPPDGWPWPSEEQERARSPKR